MRRAVSGTSEEGGASRCSCALCLGVAAGQPNKERVREYCGTLLMASAWLAWKWMEMGTGTGMDEDATKAGSAEFASPTESARSPEGPEGGPLLCRQCREDQWQLSTATMARPATVVVDDDWAQAGMAVNVTGPQGWVTDSSQGSKGQQGAAVLRCVCAAMCWVVLGCAVLCCSDADGQVTL